MPDLRERFVGAILGTLLGDALGAPWEGERPAPPLAFPALGRYTDDGQMTLALAEAIVEARGVDGPTCPRWFAQRFDASRGYGGAASMVLRALQKGETWDAPAARMFGGVGSFGNGAAMRAAPVGLWHHPDPPQSLRDAAALQARVTHTHPLGIEGAVLQAAAVALAVRGTTDGMLDALQEVATLPEYVDALERVGELLASDPTPGDVARVLGVGIEAHRSVPTALYGFLRHPDSFVDAVTYAVLLGGDCDTIGAMCGAISGAYLGVDALPANWLVALEDGRHGREYAIDLAGRLCDAWQEGPGRALARPGR